MVDEDVALAHGAEDVHLALGAASLLQLGRGHSLPWRIAKLAEPLDRVDVGEIVEAEQSRALEDLLGLDLHRLDQLVAQAGLHLRGDLEPDDLAEAAAADLLLDRQQEVVGLVGDVVVGVARDPEERVVDDLHPREEVIEIGRDHVLERDEGEPVADREEPPQQLLRHLDPGGDLLVLLRVAEQDPPVQGHVRDVGEGPAAPDHQWRERREDLAGEEMLDLLALLRVGVGQGDDAGSRAPRAPGGSPPRSSGRAGRAARSSAGGSARSRRRPTSRPRRARRSSTRPGRAGRRRGP